MPPWFWAFLIKKPPDRVDQEALSSYVTDEVRFGRRAFQLGRKPVSSEAGFLILGTLNRQHG